MADAIGETDLERLPAEPKSVRKAFMHTLLSTETVERTAWKEPSCAVQNDVSVELRRIPSVG